MQEADTFSSQASTDVQNSAALLLQAEDEAAAETSRCSLRNFHWVRWWAVFPNYLQTTSSAVTGGVPGHIWSSLQLTPHSARRWGVEG